MTRVLADKGLRLTFGAAIFLVTLATPGVAMAGGSVALVALQPVASGAYGSVLDTQTIPVAGGTISATDKYGTTYTLAVPPRAFANPVQIALLSPSVPTPGGCCRGYSKGQASPSSVHKAINARSYSAEHHDQTDSSIGIA